MSKENPIDIDEVEDAVSYDIILLRQICSARNLQCNENKLGSGNENNVFYAITSNNQQVVVRISIKKQPSSLEKRNKRLQCVNVMNAHGEFFAKIYEQGLVLPNGQVLSFQEAVGYDQLDNVYEFEIMQFLPGKHPYNITKNKETLTSLYDFLRNFWLHGWSHNDLVLRNMRYIPLTNTWLLIDLDKVKHKLQLSFIPPQTVYEFFNIFQKDKIFTLGDANSIALEILQYPEWVDLLERSRAKKKRRHSKRRNRRSSASRSKHKKLQKHKKSKRQ